MSARLGNENAGSLSVEVSYGNSSTPFDCKGFHLTGRGIEFNSRWPFQIGTELLMEFDAHNENLYFNPPGMPARVCAAGIVVDCEMIPETCGLYKVTLLLSELPKGARSKLKVLSRLIARAAEE